ncbi:MAG: hypothetical protein ACLFTT_02860 [Candidatus Hydrogenedentota bacterium]
MGARESARRVVGVISAVLAVLAAGNAVAENDPPPVTLAVWAVHATNEGREEPNVDSALVSVREALRGLPFDTFHNLMHTRRDCPVNTETKVRIDKRYTLVVQPLDHQKNGRARLDVCVLMQRPPKDGKKTKPVAALSTVLVLSPDKEVTLGGLKLDDGELVLILAAS